MKAPLSRLAYVMVFLTVMRLCLFYVTRPKGIPGLLERQHQIQEMEKRNTALAREIEQKRERINRLTGNAAEQEMESAIG